MKIKFLPKQHLNEGVHILSGLHFKYGEVKDIPNDEKIRVRIGRDYHYVNLIEDLLSNPAYLDADTNKNPYYQCSRCDKETTAEGFSDPLTGNGKLFEIESKRFCPECFKVATNAIPLTN